MLELAKLYGIVDLAYVGEDELVLASQQLLAGGVGILQLRAKSFAPDQIADLAKLILPFAKEKNIPLIINDHVEVAVALGADGVHLGQEDGDIAVARAALGSAAIIGRSTHSLAQAVAAEQEGADYIGFGPLYATPTKPGRAAIGLTDIGRVHQRVALPIFCIGGIKAANLPEVLAAGAHRVCIVSELLQASDRAEQVSVYKKMLSE